MWDEAIAGFLDAPLWAQCAMVGVAILAVVLGLGPAYDRRRYAQRLAALAASAHAPLVRGAAGFCAFSVQSDGRTFEVRHDYWSTRTTPGGPRGHLLLVSTPLADSRWEMHNVDVRLATAAWRRFAPAAALASGDPDFDARFLVIQDGVPVRDLWLDAPTRAAITAAFDASSGETRVLVDRGHLVHVTLPRWMGITPSVLPSLLSTQAALASALERTAR
jgi:hypothetical protein